MTVCAGVIGAGTIGQDHIRRLSRVLSNARVTAIADVDQARATAVAQATPGARAFASGHELIAAPDVDAVLIATWGPSHEEFVLSALAVGKPVFCEKPLAPTTDACLRIVDAEIARGLRLVQVGFMRRFDAGYRAMKAVLDKGTLGAPLMVHCAHRGPSAPPTFTSDMLISDSAIHELDLMRWLLDEETVAVTVLRPRTSSAHSDLISPQIVLLESESGVLVDIEVFVNAVYGYDIRCELVGELGTVSLGDVGDVVVTHAGQRSGHVPEHWIERFRAAYDLEMQAWIDSVGAGRAVGPSAWDGYAATAAAAAGLESLQSGQRVAVNMRPRPDFYATG